jgi:hypothetical protein
MYSVHCHLLAVLQIVSELPSAAHQSTDILTDKHTLKEKPEKQPNAEQHKLVHFIC